MKVLVFGSRSITDPQPIRAILTDLHHNRRGGEGFTLVHGAAQGADTIAADICRTLEWSQIRAYPADWETHAEDWCPGERCTERRGRRGGKTCMVAGPRRNQEMINAEMAPEPIDLAVGFIDKPLRKSRGSYDMFKRARTAEIAVWLLWIPTNVTGAMLGEPRTAALRRVTANRP